MFILINRPQLISKQNFMMIGADIECTQGPPAWPFQNEFELQTQSVSCSQFIIKIKQSTKMINYNP